MNVMVFGEFNALMVAILNNSVEMVKLLLNHESVDIGWTSPSGQF